jgi:hypothetical protein
MASQKAQNLLSEEPAGIAGPPPYMFQTQHVSIKRQWYTPRGKVSPQVLSGSGPWPEGDGATFLVMFISVIYSLLLKINQLIEQMTREHNGLW